MINYLYTYLSLYVMCILFYYWIQVDDKLFIHLPYLNLYVMCILFYYWIQVDDKLFIHLFKSVCNVYFILLLDTGG